LDFSRFSDDAIRVVLGPGKERSEFSLPLFRQLVLLIERATRPLGPFAVLSMKTKKNGSRGIVGVSAKNESSCS